MTSCLYVEPTQGTALNLPIYTSSVAAGFPSPAEGSIDKKLDLNEYLIDKPAATFFVRVEGDSMEEASIFANDLLVVDKSKTPVHGSIVIASLNGEFTVKKLLKINGEFFLKPENSKYKTIKITREMECEIWGVVTSVIHKFE